MIVLEAALDHVVRKFGRHLQIIKPSVEMILQQIEANPETNGLKRLLAVKKSFAEFEQKVEHYAKILRNILADDEDMRRYFKSYLLCTETPNHSSNIFQPASFQ